MSTFKNTKFADIDHSMIKLWRELKPVEHLSKRSEDEKREKKVFVDGPPFCTGTMHYGHQIVGFVKDSMSRYFSMNGFYVERQINFDSHGLPIEQLIKKLIGYNTKQELIEYGITNHNNLCREKVDSCIGQWIKDFERMGRWVDPKHQYTTKDLKYMESVIWVFSELFKKNLIYEGYKVMPYSTTCGTPLSHFEAKQNYKTVMDNSIVCKFEIDNTDNSIFKIDSDNDYPSYFLVWTTTGWTIPSNMALCTGENIEFVYCLDNEKKCYLLMSKNKFDSLNAEKKDKKQTTQNNQNNQKTQNSSSKMPEIMKSKTVVLATTNTSTPKRFTLLKTLTGYDIKGMTYKPLYPSPFNTTPGMYTVINDNYVKDSGEDSGTGIVHNSPAHGEDDYRVCFENKIIDHRNSQNNIINLIDDDGKFLPDVPLCGGLYFKNAEKIIIKDLTDRGLIFETKQYSHSYPHCYRTDTPLIYKLVNAWFLAADDQELRQRMVDNNKKTEWHPKNVGTTDFDNWISGSVAWCISRSRYWGTPLPVWQSADKQETICVGSIQELRELSGQQEITDLHIDFVDKIEIPSREGRGMLKRVEGVLDCWFESGCAPISVPHYPFENKNMFDNDSNGLSDFITESKDQVRGWFYTLNVLSSAIFNKPAFSNVIVTGIINGTDGEKMSKSKGNYPDPNILMDECGADALRMYLLSTPVVKAESIKFNKEALVKLQNNTIVKMYNIMLFLLDKVQLYNKSGKTFTYPTMENLSTVDNVLDKWILNKTRLLLIDTKQDLDNYKIASVVSRFTTYIDQLTNWYVKMARERLKGSSSKFNKKNNSDDESDEWEKCLWTLFYATFNVNKMLAPIIPFMSEHIHQTLKGWVAGACESVHYESYPMESEFIVFDGLESKFKIVQNIITLIREIRDNININLKRPVYMAEIGCIDDSHWDIVQDILGYVNTESNVLKVSKLDMNGLFSVSTEPLLTELSAYFKSTDNIKHMKVCIDYIKKMDSKLIKELEENKFIVEPKTGMSLPDSVIKVKYSLIDDKNKNIRQNEGIIVKLDPEYNDIVKDVHWCRLINVAIQKFRKESLLKMWDVVQINYHTDSQEVKDFILSHYQELISTNISSLQYLDSVDVVGVPIIGVSAPTVYDILSHKITFSLC